MKKILTSFGSVLLLLLLSNNLFSQIPVQIENGLKTGNAKMIASCFNDNVELVILDKENICSKSRGR